MEHQRSPESDLLTQDACWARLRATEIARVAVVIDGRPEIFPVNVIVDHGSLVFRTGSGTKFDAVTGGAPVAVEADGRSDDSRRAWSVVVKGVAHPVLRNDEVLATFELPLVPWQAGLKDHFVRVVPETVSGREFPVLSPRGAVFEGRRQPPFLE